MEVQPQGQQKGKRAAAAFVPAAGGVKRRKAASKAVALSFSASAAVVSRAQNWELDEVKTVRIHQLLLAMSDVAL